MIYWGMVDENVDAEKTENKRDSEITNLLLTYYQSFNHSQGDANLQGKMYLLMFLDSPDLVDLVIDLDTKEVEARFNDMFKAMPKMHEDTEINIVAGMIDEWTNLKKTLMGKELDIYTRAGGREVLIKEIAKGVVGRDLVYQAEVRRNRPETVDAKHIDSKFDKHASFVRKFVINKRSTGNRFFDRMYEDISNVVGGIVDANKDPMIPRLERLWEANHPGHKFFPENNYGRN